jgi:hypothetical protein
MPRSLSASDLERYMTMLEVGVAARPGQSPQHPAQPEVGAFYWTDMAPDIVNPGREEQGSVSV